MVAKKKEVKENLMKIRTISTYDFKVNDSVIPMVELKIDENYRYNNGYRYGYKDPVKIFMSRAKFNNFLQECGYDPTDYDALIDREVIEVKRNLQGKITGITL